MKTYSQQTVRKIIRALLTGILLATNVLAGGHAMAADQLSGKLVVTGASTLAPLIAEIGKRFESLYPKVRVDVQTGGSSRGIADAPRARRYRHGLACHER